MTPPVFQVAVLAAARIEQRPEPVGSVGRGRSRHPVLTEDRIADLEVELTLEIHVAGREREGIGGVGRAARGGAAARLVLAGFGLAEVGGRREQSFGSRRRRPRRSFAERRQAEAEPPQKRSPRRARRGAPFSTELSGTTRLRDRETWNFVSALVLRQKLMLVRAPTTVASFWPATLPPGWKIYWKSGCSDQPGLIWKV